MKTNKKPCYTDEPYSCCRWFDVENDYCVNWNMFGKLSSEKIQEGCAEFEEN